MLKYFVYFRSCLCLPRKMPKVMGSGGQQTRLDINVILPTIQRQPWRTTWTNIQMLSSLITEIANILMLKPFAGNEADLLMLLSIDQYICHVEMLTNYRLVCMSYDYLMTSLSCAYLQTSIYVMLLSIDQFILFVQTLYVALPAISKIKK